MVEIVFQGQGKKKEKSAVVRLVFQGEDKELGKALRLVPSDRDSFTIGLGEESEFSSETARRAAGKAVLFSKSTLKAAAISLSPKSPKKFLASKEALSAFVEGAILASYSFSKYKTSENEESSSVSRILLPVAKSPEVLRAKAIAEATNWAREIQNEPANVATPTMLSLLSAKESKVFGLNCKIYSRPELEKMGFGAMLAVSKGSVEEPKLIVLEYLPKSGVAKKKIALVGKGVCFDSGGISIKPSEGMDEMKFDKNGAVVAIAFLRLASMLNLPYHIVSVVPAVENMPSGSASRPGDIVKAYNGKTIEILNTDAEGRLILADAIAFACKEHKPDVLIDLATLTGACVAALGDVAAGLFSNDETLRDDLFLAGLASGEKVWELPMMWKEYDDKVKSEVADVKNLGSPREAGATAGASFLKIFVSGCKWAHLDIAGTAWRNKPSEYMSRGGTGFGMRLLAEYLRQKK